LGDVDKAATSQARGLCFSDWRIRAIREFMRMSFREDGDELDFNPT